MWALQFWPGCHAAAMLTELYIEALLADEALADEVWTLWDAGVITDELAALAWAILAIAAGENIQKCHVD